ncbi:TlpA family protein disulfide reductase [Streptococcus caprae]|uniref:TlpA family protein disulfide reductase n=1 Tax=Streptococcus caprae TaxID=1640501 RepID=A0ABV8CW68_9STRE
MLKRLLLCSSCLFLLSACSMAEQQSLPAREEVAETQGDNGLQTVVEGQKAPELNLMDQDGNSVSLADYTGKKVYINFWASWCKPCLKEMPQLEKIYQKYKDNPDYAFLSVTSPSDAKFANAYPVDETQEKILATAKKAGITYPVFFDHKDSAIGSYTIRAFPSHVFINSDGTVSKVFAGELAPELIEAGLEAMK